MTCSTLSYALALPKVTRLAYCFCAKQVYSIIKLAILLADKSNINLIITVAMLSGPVDEAGSDGTISDISSSVVAWNSLAFSVSAERWGSTNVKRSFKPFLIASYDCDNSAGDK